MTDGTDIRLILADIDGTLVARAGAVSAYTMQTLDMAAERGIIFAPATGRFHCLTNRAAALKAAALFIGRCFQSQNAVPPSLASC